MYVYVMYIFGHVLLLVLFLYGKNSPNTTRRTVTNILQIRVQSNGWRRRRWRPCTAADVTQTVRGDVKIFSFWQQVHEHIVVSTWVHRRMERGGRACGRAKKNEKFRCYCRVVWYIFV